MYMRIEQIEINKIRVTLSCSELDEMNISLCTLNPDSPQLKCLIFKIMERVRHETKFNPYSGQIMIEALKTNNIGVTFFLTKLPSKKTAASGRRVRVKRAAAAGRTGQPSVFCFEDFEAFLAVCRHIAEPDTFSSCSLYEYKSSFYLTVPKPLSSAVLYEFSEPCTKGSLSAELLKEHARHICSGKKLTSMICGIKQL